MKLQDLSKYTFEYSDDGNLSIVNSIGNAVNGSNGKTHSVQYALITDSGEPRSLSKGMIVFLIKNPEFSIMDIHPLEQRIRFTDDGEVIDLYDWSGRKLRFNKFRNFDDVMMTVMCMKSVLNGNVTPIHKFIIDSRENAIGTVARLLGKGYSTIEPFACEGEEQFIEELHHANVQRIYPLFAWLCKCIKTAYKLSLSKLSFDKVESKISSKRWDETRHEL